MPIQFACRCGQRLAVKDELAGRAVKCPKCGQPIQVPTGSAAAAPAMAGRAPAPGQMQPPAPAPVPGPLGAPPPGTFPPSAFHGMLDDAGLGKPGEIACPACNAGMRPGSVLCIKCGLDLRTGRRLETEDADEQSAELDEASRFQIAQRHGHHALDKAELAMAREAAMQKSLSKGAPLWLLLLCFLASVGFVAAMVFLPGEQKPIAAFWIMVGMTELVRFICFIWIVIIGFSESVTMGLLALIPGVNLYVIIVRWGECGRPFVMNLVVSVIGYALAYTLLLIIPTGIDSDSNFKKKGASLPVSQPESVASRLSQTGPSTSVRPHLRVASAVPCSVARGGVHSSPCFTSSALSDFEQAALLSPVGPWASPPPRGPSSWRGPPRPTSLRFSSRSLSMAA